MKYIIISILAIIICFGMGIIAAYLLRKKVKNNFVRIIISLGVSVGTILLVCGIYFMDYYHPDEIAINALNGNDKVCVTKVKGGYYFDGPAGNERALVFYPGAKVAVESYAPLMLMLAENGEDCFMVKMPLNFALFNINAATNFIDSYDYNEWDIAGHSMGGVAAANYAIANSDKINRVIFLASYPNKPMPDKLKAISIYGDCDECLSRTQYENAINNFPKNYKEFIIKGGNHSQMGSYGHQKGDGNANISYEQQWQQVINIITDK